jgi:hypothetical protein
MAQLDLTNIAAASIATPPSGVLSLYSELTGPPAKRLSTKDDAGAVVTLIGAATADQGAGRLTNKDLDDATTKIVDDADTTKKLGFSLGGNTTGITLTLSTAQSTSQTLSFPNIAGADTLMTLGLAQTVTGALTCSGLNAVLMSSSGLTIRNPANTFSYTLVGAAIVAARQLNLPLITATDTLMCLGLAQTVTGILTLTTPVIGAATGTSVVLTGVITSSSPTAGIGYATGAGSAVTQLTSKATATPTINTMCGKVTMNAASLAADTSVTHTLTNSSISTEDMIIVNHDSGGTLGAYNFAATAGAGSATVTVHNNTPGALAEAIVYNFMVFNGVVA